MRHTFEYYKDINIDGVIIRSRRGLKGNSKDGMFEVFEIIGKKCGTYQGEQGNWQTGMLYNLDKFTYTEAIEDWKAKNLPKFIKVVA